MYFLLTTSIMNTMFFTSGLDKMRNYTKVVNGLEKRLNKTIPYTSILIMCAIVIEIMCPLVIFFCIWKRSKQNDRKGMYASIILMMFTVMWPTLFYHFPPTTSAKYYPFMSNLALIGGLGLMTLVFNGNVLF